MLAAVLGALTMLMPAAGDGAVTLDELRRLLPESKPWEKWLETSGELPPDFDAFPSQPLLPDPLVVKADGADLRVDSAEAWMQHRQYWLDMMEHWFLGTVPPSPDHVDAEVLSEAREVGCTRREVELRFGPENKAHLYCELVIPDVPGPFPVFMTQDNHLGWARIALRRGYLTCVYAGADTRDDTDSFLEAYPGYDWSRITRRAWAAGRCIDYLLSVPQADAARIAITGHSRNGKLSLMAGALDPRIAVVISSSSGAGGSMPTRYCSEQQFGEGIEMITRSFPEWFHPRWRFFTGREDRLPFDMHTLIALSAPRPCLLSVALNDSVESVYAGELAYLAVQPVYDLFGARDKLRILYRPMGHETWPTVIERYLDWCDTQFGRGAYAFPERLIYPHGWDAWCAANGRDLRPEDTPARALEDALRLADGTQVASAEAWPRRREEVRAAVQAMLGETPPGAANVSCGYGKEPRSVEVLLDREAPAARLQKEDVVFGEYLNGDIYVPREVDLEKDKAAIPAILWLHPVAPPSGYGMGYKRGDEPHVVFARAGFAVFCYDQLGHGRRIEDVEEFYTHHPHWSLMGKMVRDAQAALDKLLNRPYVDPDKVYVVGYGLGAMVGLHLCALDDRPSGLLALSAPAPFRLDTGAESRGGIWRWSHRDMLMPNLGFYIGHEDRIPYDIPDLVACCAPRAVGIIAPRLDWEAPPAMMERMAEAAQPAYGLLGASDKLTLTVPDDYNHLGPEMLEVVIDWLKSQS